MIAGRFQDIEAEIEKRRAFWSDSAFIKSVLQVNVTETARRVWQEAYDLGLPDAVIPPIPEDLTGYPEWFVTAETARRELLANWNNPEWEGPRE